MNPKQLWKLPIAVLTTPREGTAEIMIDRYWIVTDDCVVFYRGSVAQCNPDKTIAESTRDKIYPGYEVRHIPIAFVPWEFVVISGEETYRPDRSVMVAP